MTTAVVIKKAVSLRNWWPSLEMIAALLVRNCICEVAPGKVYSLIFGRFGNQLMAVAAIVVAWINLEIWVKIMF